MVLVGVNGEEVRMGRGSGDSDESAEGQEEEAEGAH
jgi:hypothetical protein